MGEYENIFILNEPVIKVLGHKFNLVQDIEYADVCRMFYKFIENFQIRSSINILNSGIWYYLCSDFINSENDPVQSTASFLQEIYFLYYLFYNRRLQFPSSQPIPIRFPQLTRQIQFPSTMAWKIDSLCPRKSCPRSRRWILNAQ